MPKNRRRLRRPPPRLVRLLPLLCRVLPAPLRRPAHLALLLPLRPRLVLLPPPRLAQKRPPVAATRRSNRARDAAACDSLLASAIPARSTRITGTISVSWPSMRSRGVMVSHHGAAAFRARLRKARSTASG